ncbi:MAG TPA: GNAT family N-acetyltransferase, partial [Blastocatellia bacterium]|nr:GNAT family N-acetyltransferase [Blastocatellia bacterium]
MTIEAARIPSDRVPEYQAVQISFEVVSTFVAQADGQGSFRLVEHPVGSPYTKNYDAISETPAEWADRFDTSRWTLLLARDDDRCIGGATVAVDTPAVELLEGRDDLALLWDIRVAPAYRGRGIGQSLFAAAEAVAAAQGCRELKVETQNINVAACRFYAAMGCTLRAVRENAYPACPGEAQFLWYKA